MVHDIGPDSGVTEMHTITSDFDTNMTDHHIRAGIYGMSARICVDIQDGEGATGNKARSISITRRLPLWRVLGRLRNSQKGISWFEPGSNLPNVTFACFGSKKTTIPQRLWRMVPQRVKTDG